jgi:DNA-directed RNA polymerase II subunit RPB3
MTQIFSNIITPQGLTELQTKLANLVLGLKSDPTEIDALAGDGAAQLPPANGTMPAQAAPPRAAGWGQEAASPSGWGATAGTPGGGGSGGGSGGGWGASPTGGGTAWGGGSGSGASPSAGGWGTTGTTTNAAASGAGAWGAAGSGWGTGSPARNTTGWSSPNPQTQSGWNV